MVHENIKATSWIDEMLDRVNDDQFEGLADLHDDPYLIIHRIKIKKQVNSRTQYGKSKKAKGAEQLSQQLNHIAEMVGSKGIMTILEDW